MQGCCVPLVLVKLTIYKWCIKEIILFIFRCIRPHVCLCKFCTVNKHLQPHCFAGVCSSEPEEINVKAGEMVALQCPYQSHSGDTRLVWTAYTPQEMALTSDTSCAKQGQMDVLVHGRSLVFLRASVKHQGNYSCSLGYSSITQWSWLMFVPKHLIFLYCM